MPPPSSDNDDYGALLSRLTALKGSNAPPSFLAKEDTLPKLRKHEADIEARFRRLASGQKVEPIARSTPPPQTLNLPSETVHNEEDDQTLEELLAELNAGKELPEPEEDRDINELLREAKRALPKDGTTEVKKFPQEEQDTGQEQDKPKESNPLDGWEPGDEEAADEYISQVLAELELEEKHALSEEHAEDIHNAAKPSDAQEEVDSPHSEDDPGGTTKEPTGNEEVEPSLDLPSAPSDQLPTSPSPPASSEPKSQPTDNTSLAARLARLSLPSAPRKLREVTPKSPPKFTDEEIESWCVICNEDATVRCLGCDGDLYCQACWDEGHRSKDAGLEERMHRAVVYNRGSKGRKMAA